LETASSHAESTAEKLRQSFPNEEDQATALKVTAGKSMSTIGFNSRVINSQKLRPKSGRLHLKRLSKVRSESCEPMEEASVKQLVSVQSAHRPTSCLFAPSNSSNNETRFKQVKQKRQSLHCIAFPGGKSKVS
jgi:hypothetical protein